MPGRHNSSSISGGIFGTDEVVSAPPTPRECNWSAQTGDVGGIFGAPIAPAPDKRGAVTKSSVEGGIFSAPAHVAPNESRGGMTRSSVQGGIFAAPEQSRPGSAVSRGMTKSSVDGGIFGGYNHVEAPVSHAPRVPKLDNGSLGAAGQAQPLSKPVNLTWSEEAAPLQPLPSARSNPNASSIQGGIFGGAMANKPQSARRNPNESSIQGGIFG